MFKYNSPIINEKSLLHFVISNDDPIYQFCEECVDSYAYSGDEVFLEAIINEDLLHKAKRILRQNKGKITFALGTVGNMAAIGHHLHKNPESYLDSKGNLYVHDDEKSLKNLDDLKGQLAIGRGVQWAGVGMGAYDYIKKYRNRPKSVIAKKIASLRRIYSKWLQRANNAIEDREAGICKRIAAKIMNIIDGLLNLLQRAAD